MPKCPEGTTLQKDNKPEILIIQQFIAVTRGSLCVFRSRYVQRVRAGLRRVIQRHGVCHKERLSLSPVGLSGCQAQAQQRLEV